MSKMSRVSIKMTAVKLIKISLFHKELSTFLTINPVSIKMTVVNHDSIEMKPGESSKKPPRRPQDAPRRSKRAPRGADDGAKSPQISPRWLQEGAR